MTFCDQFVSVHSPFTSDLRPWLIWAKKKGTGGDIVTFFYRFFIARLPLGPLKNFGPAIFIVPSFPASNSDANAFFKTL